MWRTAVKWNDGETGDLLHIYWNESVNINHLLTKLCHVWNNFPRNGQKTHMAAMSKNKEVNGFCLHLSWTHTSLSTAELAIAPKTANVSYLAFFFSLFSIWPSWPDRAQLKAVCQPPKQTFLQAWAMSAFISCFNYEGFSHKWDIFLLIVKHIG